jgi:hypothetical protein
MSTDCDDQAFPKVLCLVDPVQKVASVDHGRNGEAIVRIRRLVHVAVGDVEVERPVTEQARNLRCGFLLIEVNRLFPASADGRIVHGLEKLIDGVAQERRSEVRQDDRVIGQNAEILNPCHRDLPNDHRRCLRLQHAPGSSRNSNAERVQCRRSQAQAVNFSA